MWRGARLPAQRTPPRARKNLRRRTPFPAPYDVLVDSPLPFASDAFLDAISHAVEDSPNHVVMMKVSCTHMQTIAYGLRELMLSDGRGLPADLPGQARELLATFAGIAGVPYTASGPGSSRRA